MNAEQPGVTLRPLTTPNTLDLAHLFLRRHVRLLVRWMVFALGGCLANYLIVDRLGGDLTTACWLFFFLTPVLGVLIGEGTAECTFGDPRRAFHWMPDASVFLSVRLITKCLLLRLATAAGFLFFVIPGLWLAVRYGFVVEESVLARQGRRLYDRSANDLIKGELGDLFIRGVSIALFCGLLWIVLVTTADTAAWLLFGKSILVGPFYETIANKAYLSELSDGTTYLMSFLWNDPAIVTALLAAAFLVYALGRVAWFLCYVDLRVRRDCWDIELEIVREAALLRSADEG